jgi:hypothetical protein
MPGNPETSHQEISGDNLSRMTLGQLEHFWKEITKDISLYHGTNHKAWKAIRETGTLSPTRRFWDDDLYELERIIIKAGTEEGFASKREGRVFLTAQKDTGIRYALRSPELWSHFAGTYYWECRDFEKAAKNLRYDLTYGFFHRKQIEEHERAIATARQDTPAYSSLRREEIERAEELFSKYWAFFEDCQPVLLEFSPRYWTRDWPCRCSRISTRSRRR